MLGHILDKGYRCVVFTRTREKALVLLEKGATWCESPAEIAEKADVIFTMVGFPADVQEVYLRSDGLVDSARPGTILVDMTTTSPSLAVEIYNKAKTRQVHALDVRYPGDIGARNANFP
jgi:3-hydroxyisobutyrate dehydrogenase